MILTETTQGISRKLVAITAMAFCMFALSACSVNLAQADRTAISSERQEHPFYREINLHRNGNVQPLSEDLKKAYSSAISEQALPSDKCYANADIYVSIAPTSKAEGSAWYVGAAFIPLWPALPVNEDWTFTFSTKFYCEGALVQSIEYIESEHVEAFWYGILRSDLVNEAATEMHRKLIERLAFEFQEQRQTDLNSASDY